MASWRQHHHRRTSIDPISSSGTHGSSGETHVDHLDVRGGRIEAALHALRGEVVSRHEREDAPDPITDIEHKLRIKRRVSSDFWCGTGSSCTVLRRAQCFRLNEGSVNVVPAMTAGSGGLKEMP